MPTQSEFNVSKQNIRNLRIKINLLNYQFQVVDEISGNVVGGAVNIDADSDIRRTCDVSLAVNDSSFDIKPGGKIFLDKYIQIYTAVDDIRGGNYDWTNHGIYLIDSPSWEYSSETNILSFSGLDLMSKLTGLRNGHLEGIPTIIPQNSSVREAMISTVTQLGGFKNYLISECKNIDDSIQSVPYDIKIDQGGTVFDILKELRDILPNYEIFFKVDGTFVYQAIPSGQNEPILIDDVTWNENVLSEQIDTDFTEVKNYIEVYGKSLSPSYFSIATVSGSAYRVTYADFTQLFDNMIYGFIAPSIVSSPTFKINSLSAYPLKVENGNYAVIPEENKYYAVKWVANKSYFLFLGYQQPYAIVKDENPDSPFYVNGPVGRIRIPLYGGEYDNIVSNDLCLQRAKYELYKRARLNDRISLTSVPIYWLDVNILTTYSTKNSTEQKPYIIKRISTDLSYNGSQSIDLMTYYSFYPSP